MKTLSHAVTGTARALRVELAGDLTARSVPELQTLLRRELQPEVETIEFDFARAVALDSSGIGLLIACHNSLSGRRGRLSLINVSADIAQLLRNLRLAERFNVALRAAN